MGVIAQEVEKQFPLAVHTDEQTGYKSVDHSILVAPLIEALKEFYSKWFDDSKRLHSELDMVKAELAEKDKKIQTLETRLEQIERTLQEKK